MQSSRFLIPFGIKLTAVATDGRTVGAKAKKKDPVHLGVTPPHALPPPSFHNWIIDILYKNMSAEV